MAVSLKKNDNIVYAMPFSEDDDYVVSMKKCTGNCFALGTRACEYHFKLWDAVISQFAREDALVNDYGQVELAPYSEEMLNRWVSWEYKESHDGNVFSPLVRV